LSSTNRRSFLARGAAIAAVPAVAALAGGALADRASAGTLPSYAPIPPSSLGPAVSAQGFYVGRVEKNLYWIHRRHLPGGVPDHQRWRRAVKKYTGVLAAAGVYTASTAFVILESVRLDLGVGSQVHA
jgi:hypothetical protein